MKAAEFNAIYEKLFVNPLVAAGFVQRGPRLILTEGAGILMFMRSRDKWSALSQDTSVTVCVRHTFLRDL